MQKFISFLLIIYSFQSFSQSKFTEQKAGHVFYVGVPDYMVKTVSLNDAASIQYQNTLKNAYMIVIVDSKEDLLLNDIKFESLKDFHDTTIKSLKAEENSPDESAVKEFKQNGFDFLQSELSIKMKDENSTLGITYLVTYVESKTHYYQILCWSLTPAFENLLSDFKKIASSIRE